MSQNNASLQSEIERLQSSGGYWSAALEPLIERTPDFVRAYVALASHPWLSTHLSTKTRHLVALSLYAASTYLYAPGIRLHCRGALDAGASLEEVIEVLQLTSNLGVHACVLGIPILAAKLVAVPEQASKLATDDPKRQQLKAEFVAARGYWNSLWDGLLALDPDYFQAFITFSSVPWRSNALAPKVKELIYIATDVSATHQFAQGTHIHIENALKHNATAEEIVEVMQIASTIGISTFEAALPIVLEELANRSEVPPLKWSKN